MNIEEARLYLEHTSKDDFNLAKNQKVNRYEAIQVVLQEIERLQNNIIDEALRKLRATKDHYKIEDINNAIMHTIRILERSDKE